MVISVNGIGIRTEIHGGTEITRTGWRQYFAKLIKHSQPIFSSQAIHSLIIDRADIYLTDNCDGLIQSCCSCILPGV
jgi:hypothetical protein